MNTRKTMRPFEARLAALRSTKGVPCGCGHVHTDAHGGGHQPSTSPQGGHASSFEPKDGP